MKRKTLTLFLLGVLLVALTAGVAVAATVTCTLNTTCKGTPVADTITGTSSNDFIRALAGKDSVNPGPGNDIVRGEENKDIIGGFPNGADSGDDSLLGGDGRDTIVDVNDSEDDTDVVNGGAGDDTIDVEDGDADDSGDCGEGSDTLEADLIFVEGGGLIDERLNFTNC